MFLKRNSLVLAIRIKYYAQTLKSAVADLKQDNPVRPLETRILFLVYKLPCHFLQSVDSLLAQRALRVLDIKE